MEGFIKEKLEIEVKVIRCKLSGRVIVVTLEDQEMKRRVMNQKYK